jgi:hypothetical protein
LVLPQHFASDRAFAAAIPQNSRLLPMTVRPPDGALRRCRRRKGNVGRSPDAA